MKPLILSLETATTACSVALHKKGELQASSELFIARSASSKLLVMIDELMKRCNTESKQLHGIAVSSGPGSYTGLRIGVATAKGLCYALNIPLIAVSTLEALTRQMYKNTPINADTFLCPMIDSRQNEIFCMTTNNKGEIRDPIQAKNIEKQSFDPWLKQNKMIFFGTGVSKCRALIKHPNATFIPSVFPSATQVGEIAYEKFNNNQLEDPFPFEPYYLKDIVAQKPQPAKTL